MRVGAQKKLLLMAGIGLLMIFACPVQTDAAQTVTISIDETGALSATKNQKILTDCYLALKKSDAGYSEAKPTSSGSKIYYFDENGTGHLYDGSGYLSILYHNKQKNYYAQDGTLAKNRIVGNKKTGYRYVDETGIVIKDKTVQYAVKFVIAHSKSSDSRSKRLRSCYEYLYKHYKYQRFYGNLYPKAKDMASFAKYMFKNKRGNCHRYAACFAYISRVLGYDSQVAVGSISSTGASMTPHGWTLVKKSGNWYVCDPDMEFYGIHDYMKTHSTCRTSTTRKCKLIVRNGAVKWK